jgi:hypothetical protein
MDPPRERAGFDWLPYSATRRKVEPAKRANLGKDAALQRF